jgi:hypothetical protein
VFTKLDAARFAKATVRPREMVIRSFRGFYLVINREFEDRIPETLSQDTSALEGPG